MGAAGRQAARKGISVGRSDPDCIEIGGGLVPGDSGVVSDCSGFNGFTRISLK